jgi:hypothetical protein
MKFLWLILDFLMTPLGIVLGSLGCGLWWKLYENQRHGLVAGGFILLTLYAFVYETGYKKYLKQRGMRGYYYIVFVMPVFLATVSFICGVLKYVLHLI